MLAASREPLCHGCRPASYESLIVMSIVPSYQSLVLSPAEYVMGSPDGDLYGRAFVTADLEGAFLVISRVKMVPLYKSG